MTVRFMHFLLFKHCLIINNHKIFLIKWLYINPNPNCSTAKSFHFNAFNYNILLFVFYIGRNKHQDEINHPLSKYRED